MTSLDQLTSAINRCTRCQLHRTRNLAVPGQGSVPAKILFIGEAPGRNEDLKGVPFCGAAGNLLTKLLVEIGIKRSSVYITNMVKCRPPGNRDPLPVELTACQPYLEKQIQILNPQVIITLGRFAMNHFLPGRYISRIHGQLFNISLFGATRKLVPMYHPAAAFRRGSVLDDLRADFAKLPTYLNKKFDSKIGQNQADNSKSTPKQMGLAI